MLTAYTPKVLREWSFLGVRYRLIEGEDFNPKEPEYIVEQRRSCGRWEVMDALVMETGVLIQSLLKSQEVNK